MPLRRFRRSVHFSAPLIAELLGYSYQVAHRHAEVAAQPWSRYVT